MKTILLLSLLLLSFTQLLGQISPSEYGVKMVFEDTTGQQDSIRFGPYGSSGQPSATLGRDTAFGEQANLWGQPTTNFDVRIVQRDSVNHKCYTLTHSSGLPTSPFYFAYNRAAKIDIRSFAYGTNPVNNQQNFTSTSFAYEIEIEAEHYPLQVTVNFDKIAILDFYEFHLMNDSCQVDSICNFFTQSGTYSFTITDSSVNTILAYLSHEVATQQIADISTSFILSPNPSQNNIQLQTSDLQMDGNIQILNSLGQTIENRLVSPTNQTTIAISHLPKGIYFVQYIDKQQEKMAIKKFVKQ